MTDSVTYFVDFRSSVEKERGKKAPKKQVVEALYLDLKDLKQNQSDGGKNGKKRGGGGGGEKKRR